MATFKKNLSNDSRYSITLTVNETSTSIANNTSTCSYSLTATKSSGSGYYTSSTTNPIKITINGEVLVNKKIAYDFTGSTPKTITLASGTTTITHESDGTKTIQCSGYFKDANNSLGSATASGSLTLTALHKAPVPIIDSITELNTTLTGYGVANNNFVANVSKKQFVISAITYDSASAVRFAISNGSITAGDHTSSPATLSLNFANQSLTLENNKVAIKTTVIDSLNGVGNANFEYSNYIPYTKPTLVASSFTTKRAGQLTGNIKLIANGTYYNGSVGSLTIVPKVSYRYKQLTPVEGNFTNWVQLADADVIKSDGTWSIEKTISSVFAPENTYGIEIYCSDNLIIANNSNANNTQITIPTYSSTVLLGTPTWTEYRDRVDFAKLSINQQEILAPYTIYESTGSNATITLTDTSDSFANYQYVEIFYRTNDNDYKSVKVFEPNDKYVLLDASTISGSYTYVKTAHYTLSGNSMTLRSGLYGQARIGNNVATTWNTASNRIYITRIIGYK